MTSSIGKNKFNRRIAIILSFLLLVIIWQTISYLYKQAPAPAAMASGDGLGSPIEGLTPHQLAKFNEGKELFKKKFTYKEGLGPLFNGQSCFECHGQPSQAVGGEGRDTSSTDITNFARRVPSSPKAKKPMAEVIETLGKRDVDFFLEKGGPSLQKRSITTENPDLLDFKCQINSERFPPGTEIISPRHSPPIFGDGLIENIADPDIIANSFKQAIEHPKLAGRPISAVDRYTELPRVARFGWKDQHVNLLNFITGAMNIEMGLTTYLNSTENSAEQFGIMLPCVQKVLPPGPNDKGDILVKLTYFQTLLAPPKRGEITEDVKAGEKVFEKLNCAICHIPTMHTAANGSVVDPDSPLPKLKYIQIPALSNQPVHAYSDFLVHQMGLELADGIPQEGARGGEWRTTPLWGLRHKKFLLHDGRTPVLHDAIMAHGGQAKESKDGYYNLPEKDRAQLIAFLQSL